MWGRSLAQGMSGKGQCSIDTDMLQLQVGERRGTASLQLSRLQARRGRDAKEEVAERTQDYNWKGVHFQPHHPRTTLRGGATQQHTATAATSSALSCTVCLVTVGEMNALHPLRHNQQVSGQFRLLMQLQRPAWSQWEAQPTSIRSVQTPNAVAEACLVTVGGTTNKYQVSSDS
jgi:hypothetical protein